MFGWRRLCGAALLTAGLIVLVPDGARAADVPVPPENLLTDRGRGDVSEADIDFVIKVRLAGLWEIPAGEMAQDLSESNRIKKIGQSIADQHNELDLLARNAAEKLDIDLPDKPNKDQQGWLDEMESAQGPDFDAIYIDRLRAAHGKIFPAIATIRASTRNDTVRKLAQQANQFVMTHMTLLESSNIVDFEALPTAPAPNAAAATTKPPAAAAVLSAEESGLGGSNMPLILAALAGGLAAGIVATRQILVNRRPSYRSRGRNRYYGQ
jgi:putative membrane protein